MSIATAKRFTVAEYHRLTEMGFFGEDDRIESIEAQLIHRAAKGTAHSVCETRLERELFKLSCWEKGILCGGNNRLFCLLTANQNPIARSCKIARMTKIMGFKPLLQWPAFSCLCYNFDVEFFHVKCLF
jgi:hypothetical protein